MNKLLTLAVIFALGGCSPSETETQIDKANAFNKTARYGDCVRVTGGFYEGFEGQLLDAPEHWDVRKVTVINGIFSSTIEVPNWNLTKIECEKK